MVRLADKVAVVTGAQQGIGRAIALGMAAEGAHVVVNWLDDPDAAAAIARKCRALNVRADTVQGNVSRPSDVETILKAADRMGGIDILVNNAAIFPRSDFLDLAEAEFDSVIAVNLKGPFLCMQAAAKRMVAAGTKGTIINLTSGAAFRSSPRGVHYVASKAGVVGLTRAAALELAPHGIRVNAIAPGMTDTAQPRYGMTEAEIAAVGAANPMPGLSQPEDMAGLAIFLASDEASRITGQTVHVNGGQYLS
jgi:NAD(P)-dependent dehydrogenase (short-subunit alcohol dehydrogenase family)